MDTGLSDESGEKSKHLKRSQREAEALHLASTPLRELLIAARNGEGRSLRYLLDQRGAALFKTSEHMCRCLGHLGRFNACPGQYCDRAWSASYHTLAKKIVGLSSAKNEKTIEQNHQIETTIRPVTVIDNFTFGDIKPTSVLGKITEITFDDLDDVALREKWEKMASGYLRNTGTQTDCLRAWNAERGLAQRIDQRAYFVNKAGDKMPFYLNILERWATLPAELFISRHKFSEKPILDADVLIDLIRCLYIDATQWGYDGFDRTNLRLVKLLDRAPSLQSQIWKSWVTYWLKIIEAGLACDDFENFFQVIEGVLEVSRTEKSREEIIKNLATARSLTRYQASISTDITSDRFDPSYLDLDDDQQEIEDLTTDEGLSDD